MAATNYTHNFYFKLAFIFGGGLIAVLIIFLGIIPLINQLNKPAYLDIYITPSNATVTINNQAYHNAVYELDPGQYTATVTLGDLPPETVQLDLIQGQTLGLYLNWSETADWQYLTADELAHRNSIAEITPLYLSICGTPAKRTNCDSIVINYDYAPQCQGQKCLIINSRQPKLTNEVLTAVKDELSKNGYNLDDYRYTFIQNDNR